MLYLCRRGRLDAVVVRHGDHLALDELFRPLQLGRLLQHGDHLSVDELLRPLPLRQRQVAASLGGFEIGDANARPLPRDHNNF